MRNSRAFGQALVAAVACVADDSPPPAGDRHGLLPQACAIGRLARPTAIRDQWAPVEEAAGQAFEAGPKASTVRVGWRAAGVKSRGTHPVIQIALDAAGLDRVRAGARAMERDAGQRSGSVYGNSPPAARAPPAPLTDSRRGDQP